MQVGKRTLTILFFAASAISLVGQNSGTLSGTVKGSDGNPLPNATVTATGPSAPQNTTTQTSGAFSFGNLPAGTYVIEVRAPGYRNLSQENVQITPGTPVNLTLTMQQGSQSDVVRVTGTTAIQDQDAQIYRTYEGPVLTNLPIEDRNIFQLAQLMPGVTPPVPYGAGDLFTAFITNPQQDRIWSANGQPLIANNTTLDGLENNEPLNGIPTHVPTQNSVQVMNVITSNYDASGGRALGSVLNQTTKTGSDGFHGELFEFHNDDWLNARSYFDPKGFPQSRTTFNQFGGNAGGPIAKNHTFFFLSYEADYLRDEIPSFSTVPLPAFLTGNFSAVPAAVTIYDPLTGTAAGTGRLAFGGNVIPAGLLNPAALAVARALPAPNYPGVENNYFSNAPLWNDGNRADARIDHRFNDANSLFLRYGLSYYNTGQEPPYALSAEGGTSRLRADEGAVGFDHSFSASTLTNLRAGYTRSSNPISPNSSVLDDAAAFGFTGGNGSLPYLNIAGLGGLGEYPAYPQINRETTYNAENNWNIQWRGNDLRFGVDWWHIRMDGFQNLPFGPQGGYTFTPAATAIPGTVFGPYSYVNSLAAFLLGAPTQAGITPLSYLPSYHDDEFGGYLEDRVHWKRFTLNLGLRYDYFRPLNPRNNAADYSAYDAAANVLLPLGTPGLNRYANVSANNLNFAPRIGLAYRVSDRLVVRAGYGISYWNGMLPLEMDSLIPLMSTVTSGVIGGYGVAGGIFGTLPVVPAAGTAPLNQAVSFTPTQMRTPYTQFYNFGLQGDLTHNMLFGVAYVGNVDRDLPYTQNLNAAAPGTGVAGLPFAALGNTTDVFLRGTGYSAEYNSLQVNVTKRFSEGLAFTLAYAWSKAEDYGAGVTPFLNNIDPVANYAVSNFDQTNVVTFSHNWRLPFGTGTQLLGSGVLGHILGPWQIDGIFSYGSGFPFTPVGSSAVCGCPGNTPTATAGLTTLAPGYLGYTSPYLLGMSSFTEAAPGTLGTVGRNSVRGPSMTNYNMALSREFVFREQRRLDFRAEAYNIANSVHWGNPLMNVTSAGFGLTPTTFPQYGPRALQLALRLVF